VASGLGIWEEMVAGSARAGAPTRWFQRSIRRLALEPGEGRLCRPGGARLREGSPRDSSRPISRAAARLLAGGNDPIRGALINACARLSGHRFAGACDQRRGRRAVASPERFCRLSAAARWKPGRFKGTAPAWRCRGDALCAAALGEQPQDRART